MTVEALKARYDALIADTEKAIRFYGQREGMEKVVEFYKGRLWLYKRFRRELEAMENER